jgi:hypothetical protein
VQGRKDISKERKLQRQRREVEERIELESGVVPASLQNAFESAASSVPAFVSSGGGGGAPGFDPLAEAATDETAPTGEMSPTVKYALIGAAALGVVLLMKKGKRA